jgi:hypothetical protein
MATLADLTCDSDGKVDRFINPAVRLGMGEEGRGGCAGAAGPGARWPSTGRAWPPWLCALAHARVLPPSAAPPAPGRRPHASAAAARAQGRREVSGGGLGDRVIKRDALHRASHTQ